MAIRCGWRLKSAARLLSWRRHGVAAAGLILLTTLHCLGQDTKTKQPSSISGFRNTAPGVRYVGSKMCVGCHSAIYQSFSRTDMARSTSLPGKVAELGWLTKPVDIFNEKHNRHCQIFQRDSKVYQSEYGLDEHGKEVFRHTEELAYLVGSGVNGDTPVVRRGNFLFEAPLSYYTATRNWDLSPNYEVRDMGFNLPIKADCMGCHAGRVQSVPGAESLYKDPPVIELAIGCENCHGPGELHVNERLAGAPVPHPFDRSIVNPARLPSWLADNICMNCHEGNIRALQPGKIDSYFRPGTPLNHTVAILKAPIDPRSTESPLLEHYYSMTLSQCYRGSGGKLGCQNCHDPHVQPSHEESPEYFRGKCLQCHTEKSCTLDLQARLAQKPVDACSNCHMPKRTVLTVSHSSLTDHRILRVAGEPYPDVAFKPSLPGTGFIHVNAIPGKLDGIPSVSLLKAYRQELIRGRLEFKDYYFALLERLSKSGNRDPFVLSAIAQKAGSDGDLPKAIRYAREVIEQGSASDSDYLLLDGFLARSGNPQASIDVLKQAIVRTPYSNSLYESLAARQLSAGNASEGLVTIKRGLELFPEDAVLRGVELRGTPWQMPANGLLDQGIAQFKQGNLQAAMAQFQAAVQANPNDAVAHDYIGVILGESGKLNDAIAEFDQAVRLDPGLADPHFHLGLAYKQSGRINDAISEYQEALQLNPEMLQAQYGLSAICAKIGDLDGAIRLLREVVKAAPDFGEAHYNLGLNLWNKYKSTMGLRQKADLDDAQAELKKASELQPRPMIFFALGQVMSDRGELASAVENLQKAVDMEPANPEYHYNLGLTLRLKGDMEPAATQFREAIQLDPNQALAHRSLGLVLRESGDLPAAAAELRLAVAQLPDDAEGHHILGTVLLKSNDVNGAIEEFRRALALNPYLAQAHASQAQALQRAGQKEEAKKELADLESINQGTANVGRAMILVETAEDHIKKGERSTAIGELQEAISLSPDFTEAHYQLGLALMQVPDGAAKAEAAFRQVLLLTANHAPAHLQLGLLLVAQGDRAGASSEFKKAVELAPGLTDAHRALARMATDSSDWPTAVHEFQAVVAWNPSDAAAHYDLAAALKASGQLDESVRELQIAQRLNPALPAAR
jgi:tetratricopeptide (TPR) repeat protein